jgi:uracil-DNA glycosylase
MTADFDRGPPQAIASICLRCPRPGKPKAFWTAWEPIFYRGRLDGTARVLCIASDPGPTERIAHRTLVGDAGQRVQGFLTKLGLTRSYLCINAFPYALHPSFGEDAAEMLAEPEQLAWRNQFYDAVRPEAVDAVIAFGANAQKAYDLWAHRPNVPVERIPHPSSRNEATLLHEWRDAIVRLRQQVAPDPDGDASGANYGASFREADYAPIPRHDLPFGVPSFLGDDSAGRHGHPRHNNCVDRPSPDDGHTLIWKAPKDNSH